MPKVRQRKTERGTVPKDVMEKAAREVLSEKISNRKVATKYGICYVTLSRYCKKILAGNSSPSCGYQPHNRVFTIKEETELSKYLTSNADIYCGLSSADVKRLVYEYAISKKKKVPPAWDKSKSASCDWFGAFLRRNTNISVKKIRETKICHNNANVKETNVTKFFDRLTEVMEKYSFEPDEIWNVDETIITASQKRNGSANKNRREDSRVHLTSESREESITVCTAVSASGNSIPPVFIFPSESFHDDLIKDESPGSIGRTKLESALEEDFFDFIKHFAEHVKPRANKKVLLLLDYHFSHIYVPTIDCCRKNGIVLLSYPPHASHRLKPLERGVCGPFKKYIANEIDSWTTNNPGKIMTIRDTTRIVNVALSLAIDNIDAVFPSGIPPRDLEFGTESPESAANNYFFIYYTKNRSNWMETIGSAVIDDIFTSTESCKINIQGV